MTSKEKKMRDALKKIAAIQDCGCVPCRGQCRSKESLQCAVEEMRDLARTALGEARYRDPTHNDVLIRYSHSDLGKPCIAEFRDSTNDPWKEGELVGIFDNPMYSHRYVGYVAGVDGVVWEYCRVKDKEPLDD